MAVKLDLDRRSFLTLGAAGGSFVLLPSSLAADAPHSRPRLVLMVARGGLDGLAFAPPLHDARHLDLRRAIAIPGGVALPFDRDFGLHPKLGAFAAVVNEGNVRLAPAAALWAPDRSHFHAQHLLETGASPGLAGESGWLRRAADRLWPGGAQAVSVGSASSWILSGATAGPSLNVDRVEPAPEAFLNALARLYQDETRLKFALRDLRRLQALDGVSRPPSPDPEAVVMASETAGRLLAAEGGPSVALLTFQGFDTHVGQGGAEGGFASRLEIVDRALARLRVGLGPAWRRTAVLLITEFGRTAQVNGSGGTDHGTASAAVLAGGAVKPGGLLGDWPGLAHGALFEGRDVRPSLDVRALLKGVLSEHFGLGEPALSHEIFPGSAGVRPLSGLIA